MARLELGYYYWYYKKTLDHANYSNWLHFFLPPSAESEKNIWIWDSAFVDDDGNRTQAACTANKCAFHSSIASWLKMPDISKQVLCSLWYFILLCSNEAANKNSCTAVAVLHYGSRNLIDWSKPKNFTANVGFFLLVGIFIAEITLKYEWSASLPQQIVCWHSWYEAQIPEEK